MRYLTYLILLVITAAVAHADDKNAWREKLDTVIPGCIKLLEAKEHVKLLEAIVEPDQLDKLKEKEGGMDAFAMQFGKKKAEMLLKVLKEVKGRNPTMEENGIIASYEVNVEGFPKKALKFRKVDKCWYIMN